MVEKILNEKKKKIFLIFFKIGMKLGYKKIE